MDVGEDGAVGLDEGGVAGHAHVGLHVGGGLAVGGEQVEAEVVGGAGGEGGGGVPDHGVAVGQAEGVAEWRGGDGWGEGGCVVGVVPWGWRRHGAVIPAGTVRVVTRVSGKPLAWTTSA